MEFQVFHRYNRLARREIVSPLVCPNDGNDLVVRSEEDEPVLHCFLCEAVIHPGLNLYRTIEEIVNRFYPDDGE